MKAKFALATALTLTLAHAADDQYQLDTIEVTEVRGNKDERTFLQSNESISVLRPKSLNRGDLSNSVQMLNGLANVQTQNDKDSTTFSIRGISDMGVTGYQKDNLASVLVDDIFQTNLSLKAGSFENWDLETVEVRRGAQSTTQGVNSLAGNILLYHTKATDNNEGVAKLTAGNFGRKEAAVAVNQKLGSKFFTRAAYNKEISNGYIKNAGSGNDKWGARNKDHLSTDFVYKTSNKDDIRLNIKLLRMNQGGQYVQGSDPQDYKVFEDQDYKSITNNQQVGLTYNTQIDERFSNKLILGATRADSITTSDGDGTINNTAGTRHESAKDQFMSLENQFKYKSDKLTNLAGVHFHRYNLNEFYAFNLLYDVTATVTLKPFVTQNNTRERDTYAFFESVTYDFDSHHSVNFGGRFEVVKQDFGANITAGTTGVSQVDTYLASIDGKYTDDTTNTVVLPKIGYNYKNGNYSLGAFYTQGYRTGGLSINRQRAQVVTYNPEKTDNYELSYKFVQSKFVFTTNVFYIKWKDQQVELKLPGGVYDTQVANAAKSELYGAEVEGSYEITQEDSVRLNLGHVQTHFLSFKNSNQLYTGNEFPDAAKFTAQASYWKLLSDDWKAILVGRYVGKSFSDPENLRKSPEQFYTDFNTQYTFGNYMAEFFVRNIFDQQYRIYNGKPRESATRSYQITYNRMSAPREFGARLNYYW